MGYIGIVNIDGTPHKVGSTLFGTCATEAATAAKVVTCSDFTELPTGVTIHVKFTYSNTAANPTLNINSKGAKPIYRYGTTVPGTSAETSWNAGAVVSFTYDGTNFIMNDWVNTNTNTDTNVTQTATNTNANYEVLFSGTADNTTRTEGARKYSNLIFNPSTGTLTTTTVVSANATLGVVDIDTANITEDNVGNLIVTGAARFLNTINGSISGNAATATKATGDESGNNIKATYGASMDKVDHRLRLLNKNGSALSTVNITHSEPAASGNMNQVAAYGNSIGMVNLSGADTKINPNGQTGWHHFINVSYTINGQASNMWQTQIANKAGTTDLWVRSRSGGAIDDATAWPAGWTRILTGSNWSNIITKSAIGLGNVENKSSATIRGELTASNVNTALGSTASARATSLGFGTSVTQNYTTSVTKNSSDVVTSGAVWTAIDNLPEPMVFKGSLGTDGTITALPVDGSASIGDTYKVITAGTYDGKTAKVGDTFICLTKTTSANTWELIPSGDEPSGTVTSVTIKATAPIAVSSTSAITTSGTRTISHSDSGVTAGTYQSLTVDAKGHVTAGSALTSSHITTALGYTPVNKAGDTISGSLHFTSSAPLIYDWVHTTESPMITLKDSPNYGIRYQEGNVDTMKFSASGNANTNNADLCINGAGDGTVTIRGNTIIHAGNYTTYTVKKDGTGASGTWGISISGNAATATSATSATTSASADKLNTNAGTKIIPVYFNGGIPVASDGVSIPFIVGTGTTAGTWLGSLASITEYYDGLLILYKSPVAGASTTTLNINSLGAKTVYMNNTTKLTTHFPANQPILLVYSASTNSGCWVALDCYDSGNTNTQIRVYRQTTGYNADYPIIVSRTQTIGTEGTDGSYTGVYGIVHDTTQQPTVNPSTGEVKALKFTGDITGNALTKSQVTTALGYTPPTTDTNTTYTLSADTTNNKITLTPSSGSAQSITVPYATSAGSANSVAWGNVTGKPSEYSPSSGSGYYLTREPWWSSSDTSKDPDKLLSGITFAYNGKHGNVPTTGTLVSFSARANNDKYPLQLQGCYSSTKLYFRNRNGDNNTWNDWKEIIHAGNIGSQSVNYATSAGAVAWDNVTGKPSSYTPSAHNHGTLHSDFTTLLANTTEDSGWSMINSTYNGYLLKSIRTQANSPDWIVGGYGSGVCFGGSDTKGVLSVRYSSPLLKIAGGNGTKPVWWFGIMGTSGTSYNLASFITSHQTVTDNNPTLSWGTKSKVATIGSTEINVTMPANPNTDQNVKQSATTTSDWRKIVLSHQNDASAGTAVTTDTNTVYVTPNAEVQPSTGTIRTSGNIQVSGTVCANVANSSTAGGLSLYSTDPQTYGVIFRGTGNQGKHGYVQSDWATYFTMNSGATTRGWVFKLNQTNGNVASISGAGNAVFNGSVTLGGNEANTSGVRQVYNATTQSLDFIFV